MDHYVMMMNILSVFGFSLLAASLYLAMFASSKLNHISLFSIHGHEISAGVCQLYMTLGLVPTFEFPCVAGYTSGLFSQFEIMSTQTQAFTQVLLLIVAGWFVALISIIRVFAVSFKMHEKTKKLILCSHVLHLMIQLLFFGYLYFNITNAEGEGLTNCLIMKKNKISPELFTHHSFFVDIDKNRVVYLLLIDILILAFVFAGIAGFCGFKLIQSLRSQKTAIRSPKLFQIQQHLTFAILGLIASNILGIAVPSICIMVCASLNVGSPMYSRISFTIMSIYPFVGCLFVWLATPAFRTKLIGIAHFVLPNFILSKHNIRMGLVRSKPTSQNPTNHFMNNAAMPSAMIRNQTLHG